ncbi:MAG: nicotinamide mononucleotide transporter [Actinomycetota bacterium]|jgi:nicotinamide mononucleotide transporter|nr:nicotinamide mononucleotide transporter [Actinomycetota bacterium]
MPSAIEILGFLTGAGSVWLYARQRVAAWPLGIANSLFWLVLFWRSRLYLDSGLQGVYVALGLLGWYCWRRDDHLPVTRTLPRQAAVLAAIVVVGSAGLWAIEARWTDSAMPGWDSSTTVVSLVAQYMLTRKLLGSWWLWIAVDIAYLAMYASQSLYLTAALQPVFIALCLQGRRDWRRTLTPAVA